MAYPLLYIALALLIGLVELPKYWRQQQPERWVVILLLLPVIALALLESMEIEVPSIARVVIWLIAPDSGSQQ